MKIGELAQLANVTKRTVDYYTNIGLLEAERSPSNYRYYHKQQLERLRRIIAYKEKHYSLEEIRECLLQPEHNTLDIEETGVQLKEKLHGLNEELQEVLDLIKKDKKNERLLKKQVSHESMTLIQSLLVLLI